MLLQQLRLIGAPRILLRTIDILQVRGKAVGVSHHVLNWDHLGPLDVEAALMVALGARENLPVVVQEAERWVPRGNHGRFYAICDYIDSEVGNIHQWSDFTPMAEIRRTLVALADRVLIAGGPDNTTLRYVGRPAMALKEHSLDLNTIEKLLAPLEGFGDDELHA